MTTWDNMVFPLQYYEKLSTFATFGRGWTRRVDEVTEKAKEWIA